MLLINNIKLPIKENMNLVLNNLLYSPYDFSKNNFLEIKLNPVSVNILPIENIDNNQYHRPNSSDVKYLIKKILNRNPNTKSIVRYREVQNPPFKK